MAFKNCSLEESSNLEEGLVQILTDKNLKINSCVPAEFSKQIHRIRVLEKDTVVFKERITKGADTGSDSDVVFSDYDSEWASSTEIEDVSVNDGDPVSLGDEKNLEEGLKLNEHESPASENDGSQAVESGRWKVDGVEGEEALVINAESISKEDISVEDKIRYDGDPILEEAAIDLTESPKTSPNSNAECGLFSTN